MLIRRSAEAFAWGRNDCCLFAADCWLASTGTDPMADLRGAYGSLREAAKVIARIGGIQAAVTARLGAPSKPTLGSLVLVRRNVLALQWHTGLIGVGERGLAVFRALPMVAWSPHV